VSLTVCGNDPPRHFYPIGKRLVVVSVNCTLIHEINSRLLCLLFALVIRPHR